MERKLFVGNLNADATSDDLQQVFSKYGKVESVWVARKPPGFAFITFSDSRDAKDALTEMDGTSFQGQRLKVEYSRPPRNNHRRDGARDSHRRDYARERDRDGGRGRDPYTRSRRSPSGGRPRSRSPSYGRPRPKAKSKSRSRSGHK